MALEATWILIQEAEPGNPTLIDAHNGFNDLIRLVVMWTMRHRWAVGERFVFN